jgi:DNA-binding SARP family transcriptional activator
MRFEVLGPLRVLRGGQELPLTGSKPRALLGVLLLYPGVPVGIDALTEALWDGEPPPSAAANLRNYVRTLRGALGADVRAVSGRT